MSKEAKIQQANRDRRHDAGERITRTAAAFARSLAEVVGQPSNESFDAGEFAIGLLVRMLTLRFLDVEGSVLQEVDASTVLGRSPVELIFNAAAEHANGVFGACRPAKWASKKANEMADSFVVETSLLLNSMTFSLDERAAEEDASIVGPQLLEKIVVAVRGQAESAGVVYTPAPIVRQICREAVLACYSNRATADRLAIGDLCCGCGAFLVGMVQAVDELAIPVASLSLTGVDIDATTAEITRARLVLASLARNNSESHPPAIEWSIESGDALLPPVPKPLLREGGFDVIVGNPPYIDAHVMVKESPARRKAITARYQTASGAWDLYIPFWERSLELLNDRGVAALITPNKWLSAGYGKKLRARLEPHVQEVIDLTGRRAFQGRGVAAVITIARKTLDSSPISIRKLSEATSDSEWRAVPRSLLRRLGHWGGLLSPHTELLHRWVEGHPPLGDLCRVEEACTVDEAYQMIDLIHEQNVDVDSFRFINTGTIDPFVCLWGERPTRYLKRRFTRPVIECEALRSRFPRRFEQSADAKIVTTGMRSFEAFFDEGGKCTAGISTVIVRGLPDRSFALSLLAVLNSSVVAFFLNECYRSLSIDAGVNFSRHNVAAIPIPDLTGEIGRQLAETAQRTVEIADGSGVDASLDELVCRLYDFSPQRSLKRKT